MKNNNKDTSDLLASLVDSNKEHSSRSLFVLGIKDPETRLILARMIRANCSDESVRKAICELARHNVAHLERLCDIGLSLSNSSALRKQLITDGGFVAPIGSARAAVPLDVDI